MVVAIDQEKRLAEAAEEAKAAQRRGDKWVAHEAWNRYQLIRDAMRPPDEMLAETIALSEQTASARRSHA